MGTDKSNGACQGLGEGKWELVFNGYGIAVWEDEKVPEMDGDGGFITMGMHLM